MNNETLIAQKRTCTRHDRGVLYVHLVILLACNIGVYSITMWLIGRQQVYSVPDVHSSRNLDINWGRHD
jgi:hypothetical protein